MRNKPGMRRGSARRAWTGRVSLRRRLVAGVLLLVAVALLLTAGLTYTALRSFLTHRLDASLGVTERGVSAAVQAALTTGPPSATTGGVLSDATANAVAAQLPPGGVAALARAGQPIITLAVGDPKHTRSGAVSIPADVAASALPVGDRKGHGHPATLLTRRLPAGMYRLAVAPLTGAGAAPGDAVVVGFPLSDTTATLHRLLLVESAVAATTLAGVGLLGLVVVRRGLRPLEAVVATADGIAAGDLTRRVPVAASDTEVGRLSGALNRMLRENEAAFAARLASEQRLRRFLADASHELRTPLAAVRGYAELLRAGRGDDAQRLLSLSRIESEAVRMARMVEDLLLLARLDQGRPLRRDPVDLTALTRDAVRDLRLLEPERPVTLHATGPVLTVGDADRLRQIIGNLLANARTHTPQQTPISIAVRSETAHAVIEVADQGPGMSAEVAANAFQPFYRADPARGRSGQAEAEGSGLGLAIVKALVTAHGGSIELDTSPATGARFTVRLPAAPGSHGQTST